MATELKTNMTQHIINEHWGGHERGRCLQITASEPLRVRDTIAGQIQEEGFIQLTRSEALALFFNLKDWLGE